MTEKEKMLKGELYNANYDKELIKERQNIKDLCFKYNMVNPLNILNQNVYLLIEMQLTVKVVIKKE